MSKLKCFICNTRDGKERLKGKDIATVKVRNLDTLHVNMCDFCYGIVSENRYKAKKAKKNLLRNAK